METLDLQYLANIYNLLMEVNTKGEDTFKMAEGLRALQQFIIEKQQENNKKMEE